MRELARRWKRKMSGTWDWVLRSPGPCDNRAFIRGPNLDGDYTLYVWDGWDWQKHARATNLKALKAIGRLEAARRLNG